MQRKLPEMIFDVSLERNTENQLLIFTLYVAAEIRTHHFRQNTS